MLSKVEITKIKNEDYLFTEKHLIKLNEIIFFEVGSYTFRNKVTISLKATLKDYVLTILEIETKKIPPQELLSEFHNKIHQNNKKEIK